jgi:hypothetical protein
MLPLARDPSHRHQVNTALHTLQGVDLSINEFNRQS